MTPALGLNIPAVPTERSIVLVLKAFKPFVNEKMVGEMFRSQCWGLAYPMSLSFFIRVYANQLTTEDIGCGVIAHNGRLEKRKLSQFSEIITLLMEQVSGYVYWVCIFTCCFEQRSDVVKQLITKTDCPDPTDTDLDVCFQYCSTFGDEDISCLLLDKYRERACKSLLKRCAYTNEIELPKIVASRYAELLTPDVTIASFKVACENRDPDAINLYIDRIEVLESRGDIDLNSLRSCYVVAFAEAVFESRAEIVKVLLERCMHMLQFNSGHQFNLSEYRSSESEVNELLLASYGYRLATNWNGSCMMIRSSNWLIKTDDTDDL